MKSKRFFLVICAIGFVLLFSSIQFFYRYSASALDNMMTIELGTEKVNVGERFTTDVIINDINIEDTSYSFEYPEGYVPDMENIQRMNKNVEFTNDVSSRSIVFSFLSDDSRRAIQFSGVMNSIGDASFEVRDTAGELCANLQFSTVESSQKANNSDLEDEHVDLDTQVADDGVLEPKPRADNIMDLQPGVEIDGLDDQGELSQWENMEYNEPVEFPVTTNAANRHYYMYFGSLDTKKVDGIGSSFKKKIERFKGYTAKVTHQPDIGSYQIITETDLPGVGAAGSTQKWMSYNFDKGLMRTGGGIQLANTDSMGNPSTPDMIVGETHGDNTGTNITKNFQADLIYKKKDSPGLRGYSVLYGGTVYDPKPVGILRVTMTPVGKTGRVKTDLKFLNLSDDAVRKYFTFTYGVHSDLAGNHDSTPTYSLGEEKGIYVDIDGKSAGQITPDKQPYRVYFFKDGYEGQPEAYNPVGVVAYATTNFLYFNYKVFDTGFHDDPGEGKQLVSSHPYYAFKWNPRRLEKNEALEIRQDIAVTEDTESPPPVPEEKIPPEITLDQKDEEYGGGDYDLTGTWTDEDSESVEFFYTVENSDGISNPKSVGSFTNINLGEAKNWMFPISEAELNTGEDNIITVYAVDPDDLVSNEVKVKLLPGRLEFIEAPAVLDFGQDLKISATEKLYSADSKAGLLSVRDKRGPGNSWSMTAKLMKDLTSDSNNKLLNSLYYVHNGVEQPMLLGNAVNVYSHHTTGPELFDITSKWFQGTEGPVLKVPAGAARNEGYTGSFQWTLQDVVPNE